MARLGNPSDPRVRVAACLALAGVWLAADRPRPECDAWSKLWPAARILHDAAPRLDAWSRARIARAAVAAECRHGVDAFLLLAVAERESRFDPRARSRVGALGLMQLRPATAVAVAERLGEPRPGERDLFDPARSVRLGAAYLARLRERFGTWEAALVAYHVGPTSLRRRLSAGGEATSPYARGILRRRDSLVATPEVAAGPEPPA